MTRTTLPRWPDALATTPSWRRTLALLLQAASTMLAQLAAKMNLLERRTKAPVVEFYAEAGAPEGALFVDGELIGYLPGVNRL
nr:hypothetical protein [uncultured Roseateles sp.]